MDLATQLVAILDATAKLKTAEPCGPELAGRPHAVQTLQNMNVRVNFHCVEVEVHMTHAAALSNDLAALLKQWPAKVHGRTIRALTEGISWADAYAVLNGNERAAWRFLALLRALGWCDLYTPFNAGLDECQAIRKVAGTGAFAIRDFNPNVEPGPGTVLQVLRSVPRFAR